MSGKDSGDFVGHFECIGTETAGKHECHSSDGLAIYRHTDENDELHYDGFCWSCGQWFSSEMVHQSSIAGELGIEGGKVVDKDKVSAKPKKEPMSKEEVIQFIRDVGYVSKGMRDLKDEYNQFYGHLTKLDSFGNPVARFYPETVDGKVVGYKSRIFPKKFGILNKGRTGIKSELSGQVKFKSGGKYLLICAGEEDKVASFQMLRDNQLKRGQGEFEPIAVVSPTTGEGSAAKQVAAQYDFCNSFDNIILGLDNDDVGKAAMLEIAKVLPADKVKIATWTMKDPNKMLESGKQEQFVRDFFSAKPFLDDGIISSIDADDGLEEELSRPKIKLPEFMSDLQKAFSGGIPLGYWVNWIAGTGAGKTTTVNEAIREWIYGSPYKVGIVSLELTAAQYMIAMLSREVGYKINLLDTPEKAVEFIKQPHVVAARNHLKMNEFGEERFALLDDREGSLENVKKQIERLIKKHGCQLIVIDPLNDLFDASSWDEQTSFIKWMKNTLKMGITFSCVCHVRKGNVSTDKNGKRIERELTEDDVSGLSLVTKSAGANIFLNRNKYAEDPIIQNSTKVTLGKCRWTGVTGVVGNWYYDNTTHTMHNFNTFFSQPEPDFESRYSDLDMEDEIDVTTLF